MHTELNLPASAGLAGASLPVVERPKGNPNLTQHIGKALRAPADATRIPTWFAGLFGGIGASDVANGHVGGWLMIAAGLVTFFLAPEIFRGR